MSNIFGRVLGGLGRGIVRGVDQVAGAGLSPWIDPSMLSPEERAALRSQLFMNLSAGFMAGNGPMGAIMHRQANEERGQQMAANRQRQQMADMVQTVLNGPGAPHERYQQLGDIMSRYGDSEAAKRYYDLSQQMRPKPQGAPISGVGDDGKMVYTQPWSDGTQRPISGVRPYERPIMVDTGGAQKALDPVSLEERAAFNKSMTPGEVDAGRRWEKDFSAKQVQQAIENRFSERRLSLDDWYKHQRLKDEQVLLGVPTAGMGGAAPADPNLPPGTPNEAALARFPQGIQSLARAVAEYRLRPPTGAALRSPQWTAVMEAVTAYKPWYDANQFDARLRTIQDFAAGPSAKNLTALNTAIGHLDTMKKAADALNNSGITMFNRVGNLLASQTGDPRIKAFNVAKEAVAGELGRIFKGTVTEGEVKRWDEAISAADSPEQLNAAIQQAIELAGSRLEALEDQYQRSMGERYPRPLLTDKSRSILQRLTGGRGQQQVEEWEPTPAGPRRKR